MVPDRVLLSRVSDIALHYWQKESYISLASYMRGLQRLCRHKATFSFQVNRELRALIALGLRYEIFKLGYMINAQDPRYKPTKSLKGAERRLLPLIHGLERNSVSVVLTRLGYGLDKPMGLSVEDKARERDFHENRFVVHLPHPRRLLRNMFKFENLSLKYGEDVLDASYHTHTDTYNLMYVSFGGVPTRVRYTHAMLDAAEVFMEGPKDHTKKWFRAISPLRNSLPWEDWFKHAYIKAVLKDVPQED
jgi:hypothetical protein